MMKRIGATLVMVAAVAAGIACTSPDTPDGLVDVSSGSTASEQRALGTPHKPSPKRATTRRLVYGSSWDMAMVKAATTPIGRSDITGLDEEDYEFLTPEGAVVSAARAVVSAARDRDPVRRERRAINAVDEAIHVLKSANGQDETMRAAEVVLAAAVVVCDNSAAVAAVRTAADDRYHAAKRKQEAIDGTLVGSGIWRVAPFRGEASGCRSNAAEIDKYDCSPAGSAETHSEVSNANAAYLAAVNSPDADEARARALRFSLYGRWASSNIVRWPPGNFFAELRDREVLHSRAKVAANRAAIAALGRAARTLWTAAKRSKKVNVRKAAKMLDLVAAADPDIFDSGAQAGEALDRISAVCGSIPIRGLSAHKLAQGSVPGFSDEN